MQAPRIERQHQQTATILIQASQQEVWEVLKDFGNVYTWAPGVEKSHSLGNKAHGVGAGRHCVLADFGKIDEYITRWDEGTGFVYDVTPLGPLTNAMSSWWLRSQSPNTTELQVSLNYDIRFSLFGKLMHNMVMKSKLEQSLNDTLQALKKRVETGEMLRPLVAAVA